MRPKVLSRPRQSHSRCFPPHRHSPEMFSVQTEGGGGSGDVHSSKSRSSICACARVCTCELGSRHCLVQHPLSDLFNPPAAAASCFKREAGGQSHEGQCQTLHFAQTDLVPRSHCMKLARPFILYSKMSFLWAATLTATTILMSRPAPPRGGVGGYSKLVGSSSGLQGL